MKYAIFAHFSTRDLDLNLGSGHTEYVVGHASLIDIYPRTPMPLKSEQNIVDGRTDGR